MLEVLIAVVWFGGIAFAAAMLHLAKGEQKHARKFYEAAVEAREAGDRSLKRAHEILDRAEQLTLKKDEVA